MINFLEDIDKKKKLAEFYYNNFKKFRENNKFSKASEFLWGCINNLVYAIGLFYGKKLSVHREIRDFVKELSLSYKNEKIYRLFLSAEEIHANFFHDFMDREQFILVSTEVEELINTLSKILDEKLSEIK